MVYAALYCDLSLKPEKFNWANESSPNTTTSTFIPSISNDSFKGSARLVDKAVEKSALGIIKSPIGLLIIENMKVTPKRRDQFRAQYSISACEDGRRSGLRVAFL